MGTLSISITSTPGTRTKTMNFAATNDTAITSAAQANYPAPTLAESLDLWFAAVMENMRQEVIQNQKRVAALAAGVIPPFT